MMKRFFAVLVALCLLIGSISSYALISYHNTEEETVPFELMQTLGIIEREEYADYGNEITKGTFLKWVVRLSGADKGALSAEPVQIFADVTVNSELAAVAEYAYRKGIVLGNGYGSLGVDKALRVGDAAVMAARAVGYDIDSDLMAKAKAELTKGLNTEENVTVKSAGELIWRALNFEPVRISFDGTYFIDDRNTILNGIFNTYCVEGIIDADSLLNIYGGLSEIGENKISVNGRMYSALPEIKTGYAGMNAKVYIRSENGNENVIYIKPFKNEIKIYDVNDLRKYSDNVIETADGKKIKVSDTASTIENFRLIYVPSTGYPLPDNGKLVTIENTGDGFIDCVFVYSQSYGIVSSVNYEENKIYLNGAFSGGYDLEKFEKVLLFDFEGNAITAEDISKGAIAEFFATDDKALFVGYFSDNSCEITVSAISETSDYIKIRTADGEEYEVSGCFGTLDGQNKIKLGVKYLAIFDSDRRIAALYIASEADLNYGYLCGYSDESPFGGELMLRIFSINDEMLKVNTAPRIRIAKENTEFNYSENELKRNFDLNFEERIIRYKLNNNGEITRIEYPSADKFSDGFRCVGISGSATSGAKMYDARARLGTVNMIGGQILFDANKSKCIIVPEDKSDDAKWKVLPVAKAVIKDKYYQSVKGYGTSPDSMLADVLVISEEILKNNYTDTYSNVPILVSGFQTEYDSLDMEVYNTITGYSGGAEISFRLTEGLLPQYATSEGEIIPVECGDVVRLAVDYSGKAVVLKLLYDESQRRAYGISDGMYDHSNYGYGYSQRTNSGIPYKIIGNSLFMIKDGETEASNDIFKMDESVIYEYDKEAKDPIKTISAEDIETVGKNPLTTDKIFIQLNYQTPLITVVYK